MKLKRYRWNDLTFFSIVNGFMCPADPYASCYLNTLTSYALSTQYRYGTELLFVLKYFEKEGLNLAHRVSTGQLLTQGEYIGFYQYCCFPAGWASDNKVAPLAPSIEDKRLRNIAAANFRISSRVSNATHQGRIRRLRMYLTWLFEHFHETVSPTDSLNARFEKLIAKIRLDEEALSGLNGKKTKDPTKWAIPLDVFVRLLDVTRPHSPQNPFRQRYRVRNYLIVHILLQTGIRRGALAKLKISDINSNQSGTSLWIYATKDDPTDPRLEKPNQKTRPHLANIDPKLMDVLFFYIEHIRNETAGTQDHDFVFVSEGNSKGTKGNPLSAKSINHIFHSLSRVLGYRLHPHLLRHMWNDVFDEKAGRGRYTPEQIEDARKYAMGWSADSTMAEIYNERRIHQRVRRIMQDHQARVDSAE
jgi:integrase